MGVTMQIQNLLVDKVATRPGVEDDSIVASGGPNAVSYDPVRAFEEAGFLRAAAAQGTPADRYDIDGDGYDELLAINESTGAVGYFDMPSGQWNHIATVGPDWIVSAIGYTGDINASADIVWFNPGSGVYGRFKMDNGENTGWERLGQTVGTWTPVGLGEFNGDGIKDELFVSFAPDQQDLANIFKIGAFMMDAQGNKDWRGLVSFSSDWVLAGIGDLNNDGIDDFVVENYETGFVGQFRVSATGTTWSKVAKMGDGYETGGLGDFDGDGYEDVLVYRTDTGAIGYYDMDDGTSSWQGLGSYGVAWDIQAVGDFTGDGKDDIVFGNLDTGQLGMWEMDGADKTWSVIGTAGEDWELLSY